MKNNWKEDLYNGKKCCNKKNNDNIDYDNNGNFLNQLTFANEVKYFYFPLEHGMKEAVVLAFLVINIQNKHTWPAMCLSIVTLKFHLIGKFTQ